MRTLRILKYKANIRFQLILALVVSLVTATATSFVIIRYIQAPALVEQTFDPAGQAQKSEDASAEGSILPNRRVDVRSLRDLNNALVSIADLVKDSVVTVFTEKVVRVPRRSFFSPFFEAPGFEDFFRDFFGPRGQMPNDNPYNEYRRQGLGSGVIVSADGYILTNNHVIADADEIRVRTFENETYMAKVVGRDPKTDIAVIKVEQEGLKPIRSGDSDNLRVGEIVLAVGSPMSPNLAHTVTQGIVSAKGRSNVGLADYEDFIQTDAAINPGNSGGALVNLDGELVGINTAIVTQSGGSQGIGFAVPINMARSVMQALIKDGEVIRGWLGVLAQDLTDELVKALNLKSKLGVLIADVDKSGPAAKAGIQAGDVILRIEGKTIEDGVELRNRISQTAPGTEVKIDFIRGGKEQSLQVKLERLPSEAPAEASVSSKTSQKLAELLGFEVGNLTEEKLRKLGLPPDTKGVVVETINPSSMAARAGLRQGDLITSVNRKEVKNMKDFIENTKTLKKGESLLLRVLRRGTNIFLAFRLA